MKSSPRSQDDELDRRVGLGITRRQVEPGDDCLDPEVLASYADGGLSAAELAQADAHLAQCRDCRRALALQVESDPLGASATLTIAPATDGVPGRLRSPSPASATSPAPATSRIVHSAKIWLPLAAALVVAAGLWFAFDRSRPQSVASAPDSLSARHERSVAQEAAPRDGASAASTSAPASASASASGASRILQPRRDEFAAGARLDAESDRRARSAAPASPPPPPPPPASARAPVALADAASARAAGAAGRDAQPTVTDQVAGQVAPAPAPAASQAPTQTAANQGSQTQANQANQAGQANQAQANQAQTNQNAAPQQAAPQQYVINQQAINQQTGPMANLNMASPPAAKTDERRQADAKKAEANEKNAGGPSNVKSADGAGAKAADQSKSLARAKAAPESTAAGAAPAEAPATRSGIVAGAPAAPAATDARPAPGGKPAADTSARELSEVVATITSEPVVSIPILRSRDGARWWRIRAPSTIEGSADRGRTWTVEYSDPSSILVRGAAGSKSGCWMIGANGLVLRMRPNGGWERVKPPTTRGLVTLTATDHLIATVTDDEGRTYRTTDGGITWR